MKLHGLAHVLTYSVSEEEEEERDEVDEALLLGLEPRWAKLFLFTVSYTASGRMLAFSNTRPDFTPYIDMQGSRKIKFAEKYIICA
jgi:hypothetical protein